MTTGNESVVYVIESILNESEDDNDWVGVKTKLIKRIDGLYIARLLVDEVDGPLEINGKEVKKIIIEFVKGEE